MMNRVSSRAAAVTVTCVATSDADRSARERWRAEGEHRFTGRSFCPGYGEGDAALCDVLTAATRAAPASRFGIRRTRGRRLAGRCRSPRSLTDSDGRMRAAGVQLV